METVNPIRDAQSSVSAAAAVLFVSLELSRARWLVTSLSPGSSKISRYSVVGGDSRDLLRLLADLRTKAEQHIGTTVKIVTIQEIGFDGFCIYRILASNAIESHVVEAASIAVPRRRRRAKTDTIDGELLLRTLMAFKRGEPRVCAMVVVPSPDEEDQRRLSRERKTMIKVRIEHINRIKGLRIRSKLGMRLLLTFAKNSFRLYDAVKFGNRFRSAHKMRVGGARLARPPSLAITIPFVSAISCRRRGHRFPPS